mgnify:CR=1 FL=1
MPSQLEWFDSAFYFGADTVRGGGITFANALAGVTHFERTAQCEFISAYRFHTNDPLVFDDKLVLSVRYLPKGKCSLAPPYFEIEGGDQVGEAAGWGTRFDVYSWFYTYDRGQ